jgi:MerR family transcriptional regulator, copper efflux regulator
MNIGQAAKATGISTKMIRYYESIGLVAAPHRTESGYRVYLDDDLHTLRFINRARDLGFSVEQMRDLLTLWRDRDRASADVKAIARSHIAVLAEKARALAAMSETLQHLADTCHGDDRPSCPIIEKIAAAVPLAGRPAQRPRFGVASLH